MSINLFYNIALLLLSSFSLRLVCHLIKQRWFCTYSHTATIFLLPIITFVITKVISNNIALSLGMVGALSIVRFRNPVRSPLELTIYFFLITSGIACAVNTKLLIGLIVLTMLVLICLYFAEIIFKRFFNKNLYALSFTESNLLNTLYLVFHESIPELNDHDLLISINAEANNKVSYVFSSNDKSSLIKILNKYQSSVSLISYDLKLN